MKSDNDECIIELAIKIPKEVYYAIKDGWYDENLRKMAIAIGNGIQLPEGHGDLIDKKEVYKKFYCRCLAGVAKEVLEETPTIIEADTTESEE